MFNEKMSISKQTILNWLKEGSEFLKGGQCRIKRCLLKQGTTIYVDETWVDTKVKQADGSFKYVKRYMWVIVNLTTKVCYYLFGRRKREVIEKFLGDFQGTLMTDAYNAYAYFNQLDGCTHACCWAHVRRIYWSALKDYKDVLVQEFIDLIGLLYKVELESMLLHRTESEVFFVRALVDSVVRRVVKWQLHGSPSLRRASSRRRQHLISSKSFSRRLPRAGLIMSSLPKRY